MLLRDPYLQDILLTFSQETDVARRKQMEETIWQQYGMVNTILVLDMSGFSLLTRKYGIIHYLSMIRRMQLTVEPIITGHNGRVIKFEADNCFALLPSPLLAARAAITIQHALASANLLTADELDIQVSIGIDYGKILVVNDEDIFGDAVNRACKLGEDVGTAGEILITRDAMELIPNEAAIQGKPVDVNIAGMNIPAFIISYRANAEEEQQ